MSLYHEQVRAVELARDLLRDIINRPQRTMIRSELRQRASSALRHFPPITDEGVIMWSIDNIFIHHSPSANGERIKPE